MRREFIKIDKRIARKMYHEGKTVRLMACKLNPYGCWGEPMAVNNQSKKEFEKLCNEYMYCNCTSETGKRIAFYILKGED